MKQEINGVGFGVFGYHDNYILLLDEAGEPSHVVASKLVPADGRASDARIQGLTGGLGSATAVDELRELPLPRAYRLRIVVEAEPLTNEETAALLAAARARAKRLYDEPDGCECSGPHSR